MKDIIIYTTPTCSYCNLAKNFFTQNKIEYKTIDVSIDRVARVEMLEKTQQRGVPVISIDGKMFVGFGPEQKEIIKKELDIK